MKIAVGLVVRWRVKMAWFNSRGGNKPHWLVVVINGVGVAYFLKE